MEEKKVENKFFTLTNFSFQIITDQIDIVILVSLFPMQQLINFQTSNYNF